DFMNKQDLIAPQDYNIVMEMEHFASKSPARNALVWRSEEGGSKEITYEQLMKNVNKIGNAFKEKGLKKGDKVLIMIPRLIEAYETYLAALKSGIIVIPGSEMLKTKDLQYRISHGEVSAIVSYHPYVDQFTGVKEFDQLTLFSVGKPVDGWHNLDELKESALDKFDMADTTKDDVAFFSYTSGTTGNPKAVVHTHGWGYAHLNTAPRNWHSINECDKVSATADPGWPKWIWTQCLPGLGSGETRLAYPHRCA